ncbi:unnamed protein product [Lactuca saligna]|uniref:Retrotransposon gag domain-containing protein n=1 Tax=Lactuca saligna TaxID=75948 RepID=A0AA35UZI5_LACSI|nr:unnamed protein product [Lactuca saligna]
MSVSNDELMKKLEEFMIQQTQNRNELKANTNDLKAAMVTLQSKQTTIEDGLQAQSQNKTYKQGEDEDSEEMCFEGEKFEDPPEQGVKIFFEEQQTPTEAWVRQTTFSLQGKASKWYHNLRRMKTRLNWFEFSEECRIRFGPPMSMDPLGELTRLRQSGSVEDYCENFESLLGRTTGVTPDQNIWHFLCGLDQCYPL